MVTKFFDNRELSFTDSEREELRAHLDGEIADITAAQQPGNRVVVTDRLLQGVVSSIHLIGRAAVASAKMFAKTLHERHAEKLETLERRADSHLRHMKNLEDRVRKLEGK